MPLYESDSVAAGRLRAMYHAGEGNATSKRLARMWARLFALGLAPRRWVALEVVGRSSGLPRRFPLGMARWQGRWYLVSMLGECAWTRNVRAAGGRAALLHGRRREVALTELAVADRAPVLAEYLRKVPGGRPHIPVAVGAPLGEFDKVASRYPVFAVQAADAEPAGRPADAASVTATQAAAGAAAAAAAAAADPAGAPPPVAARWTRIALQVIAWFSFLSSLAGMTGLTWGNGMGFPLEWIEGSPFDSYFWPGMILGVVVGGAQALALAAQYARLDLAWGLHAAAGLVMMIWIFVEIAIMLVWSPLHGIYFVAGLIQVVLAVLALGAWPQPFLHRRQPSRQLSRHP